ncbi:MAG: methylated-DNA--[protein]-cysteine S-methyltransferase [Caulobacteraceae bacterium]
MLLIERIEAPIGPVALATRDGTVAAVTFDGEHAEPFPWLARAFPGEPVREQPPTTRAAQALAAYFIDPDTDLAALPLHITGDGFEQRAWLALREVPVGELVTYGWIARKAGDPKAAQAAGVAMGRNPIPIILPCHRVVGADGSLTGFGGGLARKSWLLDHERGGRLL